jgi:hypothetical protein
MQDLDDEYDSFRLVQALLIALRSISLYYTVKFDISDRLRAERLALWAITVIKPLSR